MHMNVIIYAIYKMDRIADMHLCLQQLQGIPHQSTLKGFCTLYTTGSCIIEGGWCARMGCLYVN